MKRLIFTIFLISFLSLSLYAQKTAVPNEYAAIDKKALQIPDSLTRSTDKIASYMQANFKSEQDRVRAIFIWIASNIQYDVANMYAINFYEKKEERIEKALRTKKGICSAYASLFEEICSKAGIRAYLVDGYTKQRGSIDNIPHAWNAANIGNQWYLFDVTWGSGYVTGGKFYRKINNDFYKVKPATMIGSHMPFDYMWQFMNHPVTNQEFMEGTTADDKSKDFFAYADTLWAYEQLSANEQMATTAYRIEKNGVNNSMIFDRLQHIKREVEINRNNKVVDTYNGAAADFNEGVLDFNEFINYRNKQFTPMKPDNEIQAMLDKAADKFESAKKKNSLRKK